MMLSRRQRGRCVQAALRNIFFFNAEPRRTIVGVVFAGFALRVSPG